MKAIPDPMIVETRTKRLTRAVHGSSARVDAITPSSQGRARPSITSLSFYGHVSGDKSTCQSCARTEKRAGI
jgi:hypothetical protein